jgi:hypothetical protein
MDQIVDLDWLMPENEARPVGRVRIAGEEYEVRSADTVESFLIVDGTIREFIAMSEQDKMAEPATLVKTYEELKAQLRRMITRMVPDLEESVLIEHYDSAPSLSQMAARLIMMIKSAESAYVKKNCESDPGTTEMTTMAPVLEMGIEL